MPETAMEISQTTTGGFIIKEQNLFVTFVLTNRQKILFTVKKKKDIVHLDQDNLKKEALNMISNGL